MPIKGGKRHRSTVEGPVQQDAAPLFSSSVHHIQTSPDATNAEGSSEVPGDLSGMPVDRTPTAYDYYIPRASKREEAFRHSGWREVRKRVNDALASSGASASRVERFERCGSDCIVEVSDDGKQYRCKANYCGDRFCVPCATARAARIRRELIRIIGDRPLRFLTLTLADDGRPLNECYASLRDSFVRLREQLLWKENVQASAYFVEITRGKKGDHWHVHLHALIVSKWVDQRDWSSAWMTASNGSSVVWIENVPDQNRAVGYVCKYATKGFDKSVLKSKDATVEAMIALRGRRLIGATGDWYNVDLEGEYVPTVGWRRLERLDTIVYAAERREAWAIGVLRAIRGTPALQSEVGFRPADDG